MKWKVAMSLIASAAVSGSTLVAGSTAFASTQKSGHQATPVRAADQVTLEFSNWEDVTANKAMQAMIQSFEAYHPGITVKDLNIPNNYDTKMNTLMAAGQLPDVGYLNEPMAFQYATEGKLVNLAPYFKLYPDLKNRLPQTFYWYAPGKTFGTNTGVEIETMFYNKSLFQKQHVALPPADAAHAWTWDQFIKTAEAMTLDSNGKHPNQAGFNPTHIVQYGVSISVGWYFGWYPFLLSAGGSITNANGTKATINSPQAVKAFQMLHDLMYKYHVMPTPTQQGNLPGTNVELQTGKVAMVVDGQWSLIDVSATHMDFGMAVLPKIGAATTVLVGAPTVVFNTTKNIKAAIELYLYHNDPRYVPMYKDGLWMPLELKYYTDPKYIKQWTDNPAHPPEYKTAVIDYTLHNAAPGPIYSIKNWTKIDTIIEQNLSLIWSDKKPVKEVLDSIQKQIQPQLQGVWPRPKQ